MKKILLYAMSFSWFFACTKNEPQIIYEQNPIANHDENKPEDQLNRKLIADLPFMFDSLDYLYFPIGETKERLNNSLRTISSYSKVSNAYSLGYTNNCNLDNILIRSKNKSTYKLLTHEKLKIKSINYLFRIDTIHGIDRFIYKIIDTDSNKDYLINENDLAGLFASKSNGNNLQRISPKNEQLIDWETIDLQGILYFRTMEDTDRNGIFDNNDRINLYEYNFLTEDSAVLIFNDKVYEQMKANK